MHLFLSLVLLFLGHSLPEDGNAISGRVLDSETGETIPFAYLHVEEVNRSTTTDADGYFSINNLPLGEIHLAVHRLGYKTKHVSLTIESNDETLDIEIYLTPTLLSSQSIEVTADELTSGSHLTHVSQKLFGDDLRQQMGATLAQTLSNVPGISQRTMGTATGRPIIRGLGDERLSILEDGINSGDISDQSADHAVTIESSSTQEIEIARGPAALVYGANAVGGIINVVSNKISSNVPQRVNGTFSITGETVSTAGASSLSLSVPVNNVVLNANLNGRTSLDTNTPGGKIENTYTNTYSSSLGISYIKNWGYLGGSLSYYDSNYGIPPDPAGHPNGVDIDMQKIQYVLKSEYVIDNDFLKVWETDFSINNYSHIEFESNGSIGTEFGLVTTNLRSFVSHGEAGLLEKGTFGISAEMEDYAVFGASTPNSNSYSFGAFIVEEKDFNDLHVEAGLRFDFVRNAPKENDPSSNIGNIRAREFSALSSSLSAIYPLNEQFIIGATLLNSFRAPSLEELYSEGPHLASYSFEIGNPDLKAERGLAKEVFVTYNNRYTVLEAAFYHNGFSNYLYAQDTGRRNNRNPDLNDFQFVGVEAQLYGFEVSMEQQFFGNLLFNGSVTYTVGRQNESTTSSKQVPLPLIPPLTVKSSLKYSSKSFEIGSRVTASAEQNDLGDFETKTEDFVLLDAFASYSIMSGKLLHTFSFNISNMLNTTYYNHLSRIKELNPEAGRNFSLLYRLYF
ncbi:MAG: TonB-dependent receptor [Balneolaceae bacterium]|nr:TonB-dependent receptor [Balneolaceae bacterium]